MFSISAADAVGVIRQFLQIGPDAPALVSDLNGADGHGVWFISIPEVDNFFYHVRKLQEADPATEGVSFGRVAPDTHQQVVDTVTRYSDYVKQF